jgi:hypothetical protein
LADRLASDIDKSRRGGSEKAGAETKKAQGQSGPRQKAGAATERTAAATPESERRWDDDDTNADADPQLLKALRQVR